MSYSEFIVLDIETTGVDPKRDDIIEFAGVRIDTTGQVLDTLDLLIYTKQPIVPVVRALTGITPEDIAGQPVFEEIKERIIKFIGEAPIVGHNISFDIDFLNAKGCNLKNPALDTLELAHTVLPTQDYYGLEFLSHTHKFPHKPSHRAMDDVLATVDLFKFLVAHVERLAPTTKTAINELVPAGSWSWGWLLHEGLSQLSFEISDYTDEQLNQRLASDITEAIAHIDLVKAAINGPVNLVEVDLGIDAVATTLAFASTIQPAVVVVPVWLFYKTNWEAVGRKVGFPIRPHSSAKENYAEDAEIALVQNQPNLSSTEAKLATKIVIWKQEWQRDFQKLFLTREEKFQWEQKIAPVETEGLNLPTPSGILVTTADNFYSIENLSQWGIVASAPLALEDAYFDSQTKTLSVNYFSALVASRRDFVHTAVASHDARLGDELFKLLNQVSGKLTELTQWFIDIYQANPPTSVYDRNIELESELVGDELLPYLQPIATYLEEYLTKLGELAATPVIRRQIDATHQLLDYFSHLQNLSGQYRYFLFADDTKFFLDIAPSQPSFAVLKDMAQTAPSFTILSPALTQRSSFDYFRVLFGDFHATIIPRVKTDLIFAQNPDPGQLPEQWLPRLLQNILPASGKTLVVGATGFEAQQLFADLFPLSVDTNTVLENFDTVGNISRLPEVMQPHAQFMLIGHYSWLERGKWYGQDFDKVIFSKMPFDPLSKPQFRILGDGRDGFKSYTLPRAIIKLKTALHQGRILGRPLVLVDGRLVLKEYGQDVLASLTTFNVIYQDITELDV